MLHKLDHVGIAVPKPKELAQLLQSQLGLNYLWSEEVAQEGVSVHFFDAGTAKLELLESVAQDSPIARFLESKKGGLHHLAFAVSDIDGEFRRLRLAGFTPLSPSPTRGAGGKQIFFLHPKETAGVLIEFCQHPGQQPALAPIALVAREASPALADALARHAPLLCAASVQDAHEQMARKGIKHAHFLVTGSDAEAALAFVRGNREACHSLTLHDASPFAPLAAPNSRIPVLISAPADSAEAALQLHRHIPGSQLCILPTEPLRASKVDPESLVPILVAHFSSAQR